MSFHFSLPCIPTVYCLPPAQTSALEMNELCVSLLHRPQWLCAIGIMSIGRHIWPSLSGFHRCCIAGHWGNVGRRLNRLKGPCKAHSKVREEQPCSTGLVGAKEAQCPGQQPETPVHNAKEEYDAQTANKDHQRLGVRWVVAVINVWDRLHMRICRLAGTP